MLQRIVIPDQALMESAVPAQFFFEPLDLPDYSSFEEGHRNVTPEGLKPSVGVKLHTDRSKEEGFELFRDAWDDGFWASDRM